jgi:GINS complex subunit 4
MNDIDDILASVSGDTLPQQTLDLQELTRSWIAERVAPEILPYPSALLERVLERLRQQVRLSSDIPLTRHGSNQNTGALIIPSINR